MNKTIKILMAILIIALLMVTIMPATVQATSGTGGSDASTIIDGITSKTGTDTTGITNVGGNIVNIITTVGIIVAVVVLLILGIKYMMGSASERAEYKKTMIPYLVGAVLIFGAAAIAKAIVAATTSITA